MKHASRRIHIGIKTRDRHHQKSKTGVSVAPTKCPLKCLKKFLYDPIFQYSKGVFTNRVTAWVCPWCCTVHYIGWPVQTRGHTRMVVNAYIWTYEVVEYCASQNATLELKLMASLFKSYVTVEHSLNSTGRHRMGNKLSTESLKMRKSIEDKSVSQLFLERKFEVWAPKVCEM